MTRDVVKANCANASIHSLSLLITSRCERTFKIFAGA